MDLTSLLIFLAIGAVAGWLAGVILKGGGFGLLVNIVVGILGGSSGTTFDASSRAIFDRLVLFAVVVAFASATQGWFVARNKIWELPLLLAVTLSLMRPDLIASLIGIPHEQRYWTYLIGLVLYGLIYLMQRPRIPKVETMAAAA